MKAKERLSQEDWMKGAFEVLSPKSITAMVMTASFPVDQDAFERSVDALVITHSECPTFVMAAPLWAVGFKNRADAATLYARVEEMWEKEDRGWAPCIALLERNAVTGHYDDSKKRNGKFNGVELQHVGPKRAN